MRRSEDSRHPLRGLQPEPADLATTNANHEVIKIVGVTNGQSRLTIWALHQAPPYNLITGLAVALGTPTPYRWPCSVTHAAIPTAFSNSRFNVSFQASAS